MSLKLNVADIAKHISPQTRDFFSVDAIEIFNEISSTQEYLLGLMENEQSLECSNMRLIAAEVQLSGKGRLGRSWQASSGENILMSCSWVYSIAPKDLQSLSLALIVSLAEYLRDEFSLPVSIKWPNDVMLEGEKLAGLLLNVKTGSQCKVVAGLGLNVKQSLDSSIIDQAWIDIASYDSRVVNRNKMIADIASRWVEVFACYSESGFAKYKNRWNALALYKGEHVVMSKKGLDESSDKVSGVVEGVDSNGFLLIIENEKTHKISDSSYSLRLNAK